jgi:hypothetical protein
MDGQGATEEVDLYGEDLNKKQIQIQQADSR